MEKLFYYWFPRLSSVNTDSNEFVREIFWSYCSICFLITTFWKVSKEKSDLTFETSTPKYSECKISAKLVKQFGSYDHLKFRPMRQPKYMLLEYIKLDTCAKFHDHQSNNNKVIMRGGSSPPPPQWLTIQKSPCQIGLKSSSEDSRKHLPRSLKVCRGYMWTRLLSFCVLVKIKPIVKYKKITVKQSSGDIYLTELKYLQLFLRK